MCEFPTVFVCCSSKVVCNKNGEFGEKASKTHSFERYEDDDDARL